MNRLFVYGIFLDESARQRYGMKNPRYATVKGFATVGGQIVEAVADERYTLTGLLVDADPTYWARLDSLEWGYDRMLVKTTTEEWNELTGRLETVWAYMYVAKEVNYAIQCR